MTQAQQQTIDMLVEKYRNAELEHLSMVRPDGSYVDNVGTRESVGLGYEAASELMNRPEHGEGIVFFHNHPGQLDRPEDEEYTFSTGDIEFLIQTEADAMVLAAGDSLWSATRVESVMDPFMVTLFGGLPWNHFFHPIGMKEGVHEEDTFWERLNDSPRFRELTMAAVLPQLGFKFSREK